MGAGLAVGGGRASSALVRVLVVAVKLHLTAVVIVGLGRVGAVLVVEDLAGQAVGRHALLGGHFVGAHLQGDGGGVAVLQVELPVKDVPPGSRGCHSGLRGQRRDKEKVSQCWQRCDWNIWLDTAGCYYLG